MPHPRVSIIIPCWNAGRYVLTSVLSALGQTYPNTEVIVVDDGSTDGSIETLAPVENRIEIISRENRGACAARNAGLEHASGAFIKFLDADDFLFPEAIERQLQALHELESDQFTIGRAFRLHEETGIIEPHGRRSSQAILHADLESLMIEVPVNSCALYRRHMVEAIGGFRELRTRQDFDFFVRMVLAGFDPRQDGVPVYVYRDHVSSVRVSKRRSAEDYESMAELYRCYLQQLSAAGSSEDGVLRGLAQSAWITGRNALRAGYGETATSLFELSELLHSHGCITGSRMYVALAKILGPVHAEKIGLIGRYFSAGR